MGFQPTQPAPYLPLPPRTPTTKLTEVVTVVSTTDNFKKFCSDKDSVYSKEEEEIKVADVFWPVGNDFGATINDKIKRHRCGGCS